MNRLCEWCGRELPPYTRRDKKLCDSTCRAAKSRHAKGAATDNDYALRTAQALPIAAIRDDLEAAKGRWSTIVREGIIDVFRRQAEFHADDLAPLGIPDEHRNIIGAQIAGLVARGRIVEVGRRASKVASRHGAKSGVYKLTKEGRERLAVVGAGVPEAARPGRVLHPSGASTDQDQEPAQLFEAPEVPPRALNAFTDAEAA